MRTVPVNVNATCPNGRNANQNNEPAEMAVAALISQLRQGGTKKQAHRCVVRKPNQNRTALSVEGNQSCRAARWCRHVTQRHSWKNHAVA